MIADSSPADPGRTEEVGSLSLTVRLGQWVEVGGSSFCFLSRPSAGSGRQLRVLVRAPKSVEIRRTDRYHAEEREGGAS